MTDGTSGPGPGAWARFSRGGSWRRGGEDRPRRHSALRGWGGVAGMATACALTAAATLIPLSQGAGAGLTGAGRSASATMSAKAAQCEDPERSLRPSPADGPSIRAIKERGKLVVGVDQNSYRWGYRDPATGDLLGFDIDLARAIAKDILGSETAVIFRAIPTDQRIPALDNGTVDLVVRTMTINCDRAEQVAFSTAYFQAGQQVLASKGSDITGYDASLKGKRVCTAEGSTAYDALKKNSFGAVFQDEHDDGPADENVLTVPNQLDCLVRLQQGLADAVVTDNALAAGQAAQDPAVTLKGKPFTVEYYGVAAALGKDDLVRRVNQVLEDYRKGPQSPWIKAYEKWLADDLPGISGPPTPKYR
ncbi:glutamate ABC transporter substrate-binding protein [Streptomyces jumonjinensis]|uniref:glutamate ABC transporter substrate-binding protein n=1 Tax=Streptomyces jumonjinensis TaxID=1945 RepID=UPI0037889E56